MFRAWAKINIGKFAQIQKHSIFAPFFNHRISHPEPNTNTCKPKLLLLKFFSPMKHFLLHRTLVLCAALIVLLSLNRCRRDLPENPTWPDVHERFQAAYNNLTTQEEINFFDFDFLSSINPNVVNIAAQRGDDTLTTALALRLLELNQIHHFSGYLIHHYGYPIWDRSEILKDSSGQHAVVMLPMAKPDERETGAYILGYSSVPNWDIRLYTAAEVDSLIQTTQIDTNNLAFKVTAFSNNDIKIFKTKNTPYVAWLDSLAVLGTGGANGGVQDRCQEWVEITICRVAMPQAISGGTTDRELNCYSQRVCLDANGNFTGSTPGAGGGGSVSGGGGSNPQTDPNSQVNPTIQVTQNFANFWSDCMDVMDGEADPSDPELSGPELTICQQLYFVNQSNLMTPSQLEDLSNRPALLQALYNAYLDGPPAPSKLQLLNSMYFYLQNGWMTEAQMIDVLVNIRDKGPVMRKLDALTKSLNLTVGQFQWLLSNPLHTNDLGAFIEKYGHEEGAKKHAEVHLDNLMTDPEYREMSEASLAWPSIVWTIAQELIGDALLDIILDKIPLFNKQDEVRDIIKAAKNGSWVEFSFEVSKLVLETVLKDNPQVALIKTIGEGGQKAKKIGKIIDKIETLLTTMNAQALERAWGIAKKMGGKLFEIEDLPKYLKYIDDLKTPKLGGYFATVNTYSTNFKNKFSDVKDQIAQVHHAVPQKVKNQYNLVNGDQLHSLENLRGIPLNDNFHQTLTNAWRDFFDPYDNAGTVPSLADILAFTKVIDDQYGHRFLPPVR